jgi:hypothetical protein
MRSSYILIKTPKTGTETLRSLFIEYCNKHGLRYLDVAYEEVFKIQPKPMFDFSVDHINNSNEFLPRVRSLMKNDVKLISSVREPLERAMSHYYFSNPCRESISFNDFYSKYNGHVLSGWKKNIDVVDNQMCTYMGINKIGEVEDIYEHVFILENFQKSLDIFSEKLGYKLVSKVVNRGTVKKIKTVSRDVKEQFIKNNEMDYLLYEECLRKFI